MKLNALMNALIYELGLLLVRRSPSLGNNKWFRRMMNYCRTDWADWKTAQTMKAIDNQSQKLVEEWVEDHRNAMANKLAKKAKELFPKATITAVPDAIVPSVIVEEEGDSLLGGPLRITWRLDD
jgi:hypothetical protein